MRKNKFLLIPIFIFACLASACTFSTEQSENQSENNLNTVEATEQDINVPESSKNIGENKGDYLELVNLEDHSPYYSMSFHKVDGETGELLSFEGNVESDDQTTAGPDHLSITPSDSLVGLSYGFDGEENLADTVTLGFWNRGEEESVVITIDGLDYELTFPDVEARSVAVSDSISFDEFKVTIKELVIYPNSLIIKMSDVDIEEWERIFLVEAPEQSEELIPPMSSRYTEEAKTFELLYTFENGVPESNLILHIMRDGSSEENQYYEYLLNLK